MFLATTDDIRFWNKDEKILFLGEWCRNFNQRHEWGELDHEVLPYHWNDRERFNADWQLVNKIYERILVELSEKLNQIHDTECSARYWQTLLGIWLKFFIGMMLDRYLSIRSAIDSGYEIYTRLPTLDSNSFHLLDYFDHYYLSAETSYNLYIYSRIIELLGELPYEVMDNIVISRDQSAYGARGFWNQVKSAGKKLVGLYSQMVPDRWNKAVFVKSYLPVLDLIKLQLSLGQAPYPFAPEVRGSNYPADITLRNSLVFDEGETEFESLLAKIIPGQIPRVYLEGYSDMCHRSLEVFPNDPKVIVSTGAFEFDEGFKFWAGHQMDRGTKLVGVQHGGGYGSMNVCSSEEHELNICDRYFSWGWGDESNSQIKAMPSNIILRSLGRVEPEPEGRILMVNVSIAPYFSYFYDGVLGPQVPAYIDTVHQLVRLLPPEIHSLLALRLAPNELGWEEKKRWKELEPMLSSSQGEQSLRQELSKSRLCVCMYNGTALLETLAANFPTLACWNPEIWGLRESALPAFEELLEVGILHYSPESAAKKLAEIYSDPSAWWNSPEVQKAKDQFCHKYARVDGTWLQDWKNELSSLQGD